MQVKNSSFVLASALFSIKAVIITAFLLAGCGSVFTQTRAEGMTPKMAEPGSPVGSYSLSGFETVNLFNGNLNFNLPLIKAGGRGKSRYSMNLNIDSARWNVEKDALTFGEPVVGLSPNAMRTIARVNGTTYDMPSLPDAWNTCTLSHTNFCQPGAPMCDVGPAVTCEQSALDDEISASDIVQHYAPEEAGLMIPSGFYYPYYTIRENLQEAIVGYGPGMLIARGGKIEPLFSRQPSGYRINSLTRLFFVSSEGTEYELRDVLTDGKPRLHWASDPVDRGTVFEASDGSGLRFVSDNPIIDFWVSDNTDLPPVTFPSGTLYFPDGTQYRIVNGNVMSIRDVDGNKIVFTYNSEKQVTGVVDSMGRQITIVYGHETNDPELSYDEIKTQKSADTWQTIKVYRTKLGNVLRSGYELMTLEHMFPALGQFPPVNPPLYNPEKVVKRIELPDGRGYNLFYTPYKEIARVELPTGAAMEYDFPVPSQSSPADKVFRPVSERRVYVEGGSKAAGSQYENRQTYTRENFVSNFSTFTGIVRVNECKGKTSSSECDVNAKSDHYFHGAANSFSHSFYPKWNEGREYKTETFSSSGTTDTLKGRTETEWEYLSTAGSANPSAPKRTRVKSVTATIFEAGQSLTSKVAYEYDDTSLTNNRTDARTYDYGVGAPGRIIKHSKSIYLKVNENHGNVDYTDPGVFMPALLKSTEIYDVNYDNVETLIAKNEFLYDETNYTPLSYGQTTVTGWEDPDAGKPLSLKNIRGNATTSRLWNKTGNTWTSTETHTQSDQFGNTRNNWDANGNLFQTEYDAVNLYAYPTKSISPGPGDGIHGSNSEFQSTSSYDFYSGRPLTVRDANNQETKTDYVDPLQRPTKVTAPNGQQTIFEYGDTVGNLYVKVKKQIDEINWDETTTEFDGLGRGKRKKAKDAQGYVFIDTSYDNLGRVEKVSSPYRDSDPIYWTKVRYDAQGRTVESFAPAIDPNSAQSTSTTEFSLSTTPGLLGMVAVVTDVNGRKGRSVTNLLGQLIRVDEPADNGSLEPLPTSTPAPTSTPGTGPTPNPTPDPTPTPDPGGCGGSGQPACAPEMVGHYPMESTYYKYDPLGRLVQVTQGVQKRYFLYDGLGRLLRVKQPEQEARASLALSDAVTNNSSWSAGFIYDNAGRLVRSTDANGVNIINEFDKAGRLIKRCHTKPEVQTTATLCSQIPGNQISEDTPAVEHFYDGKGLSEPTQFALGQKTKIVSSVSTTEYSAFDNMGRLLNHKQTTDGQSFTTSYKYDLSGNLIEEIYPSGEVVRNFLQSDGNLSRVAVSGQTYASDPVYTASGGVAKLRLGNGRWETAQFNPSHQVTQLALGTSANDTSLWKVDYEYGELRADGSIDSTKNNGNIARQTENIPGTTFVQTFKYDSLSRLKEAEEKTGQEQNWIQHFSYDRFGNRETFNEQIGPLAETFTPEVDQGTNRFKSGQGFLYDKNGNVVQDGQEGSTRTFTFNGDNRQIQVKDNAGHSVGTYFYDGLGNRIKKTLQAGETTIFVYDGTNRLIAEYSSQVSSDPAVSYTTTDHLRSPRIITDKKGDVTSRRDFMPFGEELAAGTPNRGETAKFSSGMDTLRKKFTGYEKDEETGLDYAQARYYNNEYGRFTAVDPLLASGRASAPQSFNRYTYVRNNPLIYVDTNGMDLYISFQEKGSSSYTVLQYKIDRNENGVIVGARIVDTASGNVFQGQGPNGLAIVSSINKLAGKTGFAGAFINLAENGTHIFDFTIVSGAPPVMKGVDAAGYTRLIFPQNNNSISSIAYSSDPDQQLNSDYLFGTEILVADTYQNLTKYTSPEWYGPAGERNGFEHSNQALVDENGTTEPQFKCHVFNQSQITAALILGISPPNHLGVLKPVEKILLTEEEQAAEASLQGPNHGDSDGEFIELVIPPPPHDDDDDKPYPEMTPKPKKP